MQIWMKVDNMKNTKWCYRRIEIWGRDQIEVVRKIKTTREKCSSFYDELMTSIMEDIETTT